MLMKPNECRLEKGQFRNLAHAQKEYSKLQSRLDLAEKDKEAIQLIADDGLENLKKMKVKLDFAVEALKRAHEVFAHEFAKLKEKK